MENRILQQHAIAYITGGKALVIFHNIRTGNQAKFRVIKSDVNSRGNFIHFVHDLNPRRGRSYMGMITKHNNFVLQNKDEDTRESKIFAWVWSKLQAQELPDYIHILHEGHCSVCSRPLTDAKSLELGIGPICRGEK